MGPAKRCLWLSILNFFCVFRFGLLSIKAMQELKASLLAVSVAGSLHLDGRPLIPRGQRMGTEPHPSAVPFATPRSPP